jgi:hypothetical protein
VANLSAADVQEMIQHWLATPIDSVLHSHYGHNLGDLLHNPLSAGVADSFIAKLKADVPVLQILPTNAINIYSVNRPPNKKYIYIEIASTQFNLGEYR